MKLIHFHDVKNEPDRALQEFGDNRALNEKVSGS